MGFEDIKDHCYEPGQSGNPNGRPKGSKNRATILKEFIDLKAKGVDLRLLETPENLTVHQAMILKMIDNAMAGDLASLKEIHDTLYGKIKDRVQTEHTFIQMGRVKIKDDALSFDVGTDPAKPEGSE